MNTQAFLDKLQAYGNKALVFELAGRSVAPGYHVTEVKAVTVQSMDCGGRANAWNETVVQLWAPGSSLDEGYMTVSKFLGIYGRLPLVCLLMSKLFSASNTATWVSQLSATWLVE